MIRLIRSDGIEILLNVEQIRKVDGTPTTITLTDGETLTVKNHLNDVLTKVHAHQLGLNQEHQSDGDDEQPDHDKRAPDEKRDRGSDREPRAQSEDSQQADEGASDRSDEPDEPGASST